MPIGRARLELIELSGRFGKVLRKARAKIGNRASCEEERNCQGLALEGTECHGLSQLISEGKSQQRMARLQRRGRAGRSGWHGRSRRGMRQLDDLIDPTLRIRH